MATQLDNLEDYDFAVAPQPVGVSKQGKYRESFHEQEYQEDNGNPYDDITDVPPDDESLIKPDYYIDRAPTPEYKPKEKGVNKSTQIEQYEPELFDFILEVEPVLQVIVGKTLEQARMELIEEEERIALKQHKSHYEKKRNAELMVTQRMEAAFQRRKEERERRQLQHGLHQQQLRFTQMKFISRSLSKLALRGAKQRVLSDLEKLGYLRDEKLMLIRQNTLPWLISRILNISNDVKDFSNQYEHFIVELEKDTAEEHHKYYKIEMDKRDKILAARETIRVEKEDRQKRKIEIKQRRAIRDKREVLRKQIENNVLSKVEYFENIFAAQVFIGTPQPQQAKPYVVLHTDLLLLLAISLEFIVQDQVDQIDDQLILNIWIDLLKNKFSTSFNLNLNVQLQQFIASSLQDMEADPFIFNKSQKKQVIQHIVEESSKQLWSSYQNNLIHMISLQHMNRGLLEKLLEGLMDIYFKSINYKESDPVVDNESNIEASQDDNQLKVDQQQDELPYEKPEINELDLEMIDAKKKINIVFKELQTVQPPIDLLLRLHIPYTSQEPEKSNNSFSHDKSHDKSHDLSRVIAETVVAPVIHDLPEPILIEGDEIKVSKWDFDPKTIDIYDGDKTFTREGKQIPLEEEQGFAYNFSSLNPYLQVQIIDERGNYFARKQIYHIFKERLESFLNVVPFDQFTNKFNQLDKDIQAALEKEIKSNNPETPIFDYEI